MGKKALQEFLGRLVRDKSLQAELRELAIGEGKAAGVPAEKLVALAKDKGYAFSVEEVRGEGLELSDSDLEAVAGGVGGEAQDDKHKGWTDVLSYNALTTAGKVNW